MANWSFEKTEDYAADQTGRAAVFAKIAPKGNWKAPIDCWIKAADYAECSAAAIWFTGGPLVIVEGWLDKVRVKSDGYYANIGA